MHINEASNRRSGGRSGCHRGLGWHWPAECV